MAHVVDAIAPILYIDVYAIGLFEWLFYPRDARQRGSIVIVSVCPSVRQKSVLYWNG